MGYTNKVAHLLFGSVHVAEVGILYHAEGEWMGGDDCMLMQKPAKVLYDAHIPFEIIPMDYIFDFGNITDGALRINKHSFRHLIIPYAPELPAAYWGKFAQLQEGGVQVLMAIEDEPSPTSALRTVMLSEIAHVLKAQSINTWGNHPLLRIGHFRRDSLDMFMLFNESTTETVDTIVQFPCAGVYRQLDLLNDGEREWSGISGEEGIPITLTPYESTVILFGSGVGSARCAPMQFEAPTALSIEWKISLQETGVSDEFLPLTAVTMLPNITGPAWRPNFSGVIRYEGSFLWDKGTATLDLGEVGQTAHVKLNGEDLGLRICKPYRYDVGHALQQGVNQIVVEIANTLVHRCKDRFSAFLPIPPSGLMGPVCLSKSV